MKKLYTEKEFKLAKSKDLLPCECYQCSNIFYLAKTHINDVLNPNTSRSGKYCSKQCVSLSKNKKENYKCHNCDINCIKKLSQIKLSKSGYNFCSRSCTTNYHNKNKKHGTCRSKLEVWLETKLTDLYPELDIHFNRKDSIGSELDIYIPSIQLAIELNGIFHYEPIYGENKLNQIQNNDVNKFQKCQELGISLCIIDTSGQKYFKESTSKKYLDIINNIINSKL